MCVGKGMCRQLSLAGLFTAATDIKSTANGEVNGTSCKMGWKLLKRCGSIGTVRVGPFLASVIYCYGNNM